MPDTQNYRGFIFARLSNEKRIWTRIPINLYEQKIIPLLEDLVESKKITEREKEYFSNSYFKVQENGYYYFIEDQFDNPRNSAVTKIHPLAGLSLEILEPVLSFNIAANSGYAGYNGNFTKRFPFTFAAFKGASNTNLMSPINGVLKTGNTETFLIESREYTRFAVIIDGQFTFFTRNRNGVHELTLEIPSGIDELQIYGSRNNREYTGLLKYDIDQEMES